MRVLDADVLVDLLRGYLPARAWFASRASESFAVSGFAALELIRGTRNQHELQRVLRGIAMWTIVWPSAEDSDRAVETYARYRLSHNLGPFDALIAETVIGLGATLCTFNLKHYRPIAHLVTEQPYAR